MTPDSILDKVIAFKQTEEAQHCRAGDVLDLLLVKLTERERSVISSRFGLKGLVEQTLKEVGMHLGVTRERVRQIEVQSLARLQQLVNDQAVSESVEPFVHSITHLFETHGGILSQEECWEHFCNLTGEKTEDANEKTSFKFILTSVLSERLDSVKENRQHWAGWKLHFISLDDWQKTIDTGKQICKEVGSPIEEGEFYRLLNTKLPDLSLEVLTAHLGLSKEIRKNLFGQVGLAQWHLILPKRVKDKIFLILKREHKPLHFTMITDLINQAHFDRKVAYPSTVHNELILDKQYVLVGRGIYALKEWGYEEGVVSDVIAKILTDRPDGLNRDQILSEVLKRRLVKKSTILLALTDRRHFEKTTEGRYKIATLAEKTQPTAENPSGNQ